MMHRSGRKLLGLAAAFALTAAACGGDDSSEPDDTPAPDEGDAAADDGDTDESDDAADDGDTDESDDATDEGDDAPADDVQEGEEWLLGFSSDLSGAFADLSRPILAGTETYFNEVNEAGGIHGRPVRLEVRDDRLDVQLGLSHIRDLGEMGVPVILGNVSSTVWATTGPEAEEMQVPQIAGGAVDSLVNPPQPYLYRYLMTSSDSAQGMLRFALDNIEGDLEPGIIRYDSAGTDAWAEALGEAMDELGLEPATDEERFPADAVDVAPAANSVASAEPNVVFSVLTATQAPLVVEALRNRGYEGPVLNWVGTTEGAIQAVDDPNFYVMRDTVNPQLPEAEALMEAAEAAGVAGDMTHDFATNAYLAAKATGLALEVCGWPCDGPSFNEALLDVGVYDTDGLSGPDWGVLADERHVFNGTVSLWGLPEAGAAASENISGWFAPDLSDAG